MNEQAAAILEAPLDVLTTRWPAIAVPPVDGVIGDDRFADLVSRGLPDSPAMQFLPSDEAPRQGEWPLGEAIHHTVFVELGSGIVLARPRSRHLGADLHVNSSTALFVETIWRWADIAPLMLELSHDIASIDVSEDFIDFAIRLDPPPAGQPSLWRAWARID